MKPKNRFVLPSALALAFHGALLVGFTPSSGSIALSKPNPVCEFAEVKPITMQDDLAPEWSGDVTTSSCKLWRSMVPRPEEMIPWSKPHDFTVAADPVPVHRHDVVRVEFANVRFGAGFGVPGGGGEEVFAAGLLDYAPRPRFQMAPIYPFAERRTGTTGEVLVEFIVNENGRVASARSIRADSSAFAEAALRAVAKWRFEPGRKDGRPVRSRLVVPMSFSLTEPHLN